MFDGTSSWDSPPSDPLSDLLNAVRIVNGEKPMIVDFTPVDGVYTITSLDA